MRVVAFALTFLALGSASSSQKIAYVHGSTLFVGDRVVARHVSGSVRWSGDGRLLSVGGRLIGGPTIATGDLTWATAGETAAYTTKHGGVGIWAPSSGAKLILPDGWGASSLAWSRDGSLAIGRAVCHGACGKPTHTEIWVRRAGTMHLVVGPLAGDSSPIALGWRAGRVLWWRWPDSASIAADGVSLYANRTRLASGLMYDDYVSVCGSHLALAAGGDRYAMHGKRILFDGRNVSRDRTRSWVSPSCTESGGLVAAASRNTVPTRIGREHRAIWQLLPERRQLTHPPAGRTDEFPRLLADGSVVFVRTRSVSKPLELYGVGTIEVLRQGKLRALGTVGKASNYYGHYDWSDRVAVAP